MRTKSDLIRIIQEFVGEGGYIPVTEHGFKPSIQIYGVAYDHVDRTMTSGKYRMGYFADMTAEELTEVILNLVDYENYCHLYA